MSPQLAWLDILLRSGGRPRKLTEIVLELIDAATMENDETTAKKLYIILKQRGVVISLRIDTSYTSSAGEEVY